jgi:hypothetical protein
MACLFLCPFNLEYLLISKKKVRLENVIDIID